MSNYRNLTIENNVFENNAKHIIYIGDYSENIVIHNNYFKDCKSVPNNENFTITLKGIENCKYINNILDFSYEAFMSIAGSQNVDIIYNTFKKTYQHTIQVNTTACNNISICGNSFIDCGTPNNSTPTVWIQIPVTNLRIEGNYTKLLDEYQSKPYHLPESGYSDSIIFKDNIIGNASIITNQTELKNSLADLYYDKESVVVNSQEYVGYFTDNPTT